MKRLRFWGTRGSLPVALTAAGVRDKLIRALRAASGRTFASDEDLNAYVDGLDLPVSGTYGGHTSCVEIETGGTEYVLCDLGTGVRPFGQKAMARHGAGVAADVSHLHVARALGPHHGVPIFHAGVHSRQPHFHLRRACGARRGVPAAAGAAVVSCGFLGIACQHRIRPA